MNAPINIVGAGMAGLLAGGMLRNDCGCIIESAPELPNNHSAVLRFRSGAVSDALNIPFKKVMAIKSVAPWQNPIADALAYSVKTNGTATLRSVLTANGEPEERFIAPPDFIAQMKGRVEAPINFNTHATKSLLADIKEPWISTIPMPTLMKMLGWESKSEFRSRPGHNLVVALVEVDAYCSLYVPDPSEFASRISITGSQLVAECYGRVLPDDLQSLAARMVRLMGLHPSTIKGYELRKQKYAKILPIDEQERREFIMWASQEHGVYSLGRFATWRPGLLLDDVVNDVRVIQRLIRKKGETYAHHLKG